SSGRRVSSEPCSTWESALAIRSSGATARPVNQKTATLARTRNTPQITANRYRLSHASRIARDAFGVTRSVAPCSEIVKGSVAGVISLANHPGASRPDLYVGGGER